MSEPEGDGDSQRLIAGLEASGGGDDELGVLFELRAEWETELLRAEEPMAEFVASCLLFNALAWQEDRVSELLDSRVESGAFDTEPTRRVLAFMDATTRRREVVGTQCAEISHRLPEATAQYAMAHMDARWLGVRERLPTVDHKIRAGLGPRLGPWRSQELRSFEKQLRAVPGANALTAATERLLAHLSSDRVPPFALSARTPESRNKPDALLVVVDRIIACVQGSDRTDVVEFPLEAVSIDGKRTIFGGAKWRMRVEPDDREFDDLQPSAEIPAVAAYVASGEQSRAIIASGRPGVLAERERATPVARFGKLTLFADVLETPEGKFALTPSVSATVETAGNLDVTRRPTLTRAVAGGLLLGPLGALGATIFGPKATEHDGRELYLFVEGPDWYYGVAAPPNEGLPLRGFARDINLAARRLAEVEESRADETPSRGGPHRHPAP